MRQRGMSASAGNNQPARDLALVRIADRKPGRLADNAQRRFDRGVCNVGHQIRCAEAADLLVIGQRDVNRRRGRGRCEMWDMRQHRGDEALHVGRAPPDDAAVAPCCGEGRARPVLARDRHHIGMRRQHDAGSVTRANGREQRGLASGCVADASRRYIVLRQIVLDPLHDIEIGLARDRREPDQRIQKFDSVVCRLRHRVLSSTGVNVQRRGEAS